MPSRKDGRVEPGQKIASAFSARAWNRAQQAADVVLGVEPSLKVPAGELQLPYHWVYAYIPQDMQYGECVRIDGFWTGEVASEWTIPDEQLMQPIPVVLATKANDYEGGHEGYSAYGIAVEPIKANKIGKVAVSGVVACNVYCKKAWHPYARPGSVDGESKLVSSSWGNIQILFWHPNAYDVNGWRDKQNNQENSPAPDVNENVSALVRIGNSTPFQLITVQLPGSWTKNTTKMVLGLGSQFSDGVFAGGIIQNPPEGYSGAGGLLEAYNPWCDISQLGTGLCARFANKWILVSWTPIEVDGAGNSTYFVHAEKLHAPPS